MRAVIEDLRRHALEEPDRPAVRVGGRQLGYGEVWDAGLRWAAAFREVSDAPVVAVLGATETPTAVLGAVLAGGTAVPLRPDDPPARLRELAARAGVDVVAGEHPALDLPIARRGAPLSTPIDAPDDRAVMLPTTSGSTGGPRPVEVTRANLRAFLDAARERYELVPADRVGQWFEPTFDLYAFDLWATWRAGACLVVPEAADALAPIRFARERALTVWFSVPSLARLARRTGALAPCALPDLRWSLFCGEPLPTSLASAWAEAAPASMVENLYGPTECTLACSVHRYRTDDPDARDGLVPIGEPLAGSVLTVVDDELRPVPDGVVGELLVSGPLVTGGYRGDPARTAERFVSGGYRTGDRVVRPGPGRPLCFVNRADQQVKVRGHRVELGEVEGALRAVPGVEDAVVLPHAPDGEGIDALVAWVVGSVDPDAVRAAVAERLPRASVPRWVRRVDALPTGARGKLDRFGLGVG